MGKDCDSLSMMDTLASALGPKVPAFAKKMDVPELLVSDTTDSNSEPKQRSSLSKSTSVHMDRRKAKLTEAEIISEEGEWLEKSQCAPVFNAVINKLLKQKPSNPIGFFWQELTKTEVMHFTDDQDSYTDPRSRLKAITNVEDDTYLREQRLHVVFDDLIQQLLSERPSNALSFSLSWIRFNANRAQSAEDEVIKNSLER